MPPKTALDNITLTKTTHWSHTQFSLNYHTDYLARHTSLPPDSPDLLPRAYDQFKIDFLWNTNNGLIDWATTGRITDMGHASYAADASDFRTPTDCPFQSPEEVYAFDAVTEYGLPDFSQQVHAYQSLLDDRRKTFPNQLSTAGYYNTLISGAIQTFGWDMLLTAAADSIKFEKVLESFFQRTLFHNKAWAQTSARIFIQHDDFVWTSGPFMHPDIYRKIIIPRYAELWKPLHDAGQKVLFCSDGDFTQFAEDIAEAGADGFIFEPVMDFAHMAKTFGQTHCMVGSFVDCRDLTFGNLDKVKSDIDQTFEQLANCKGAIFTVGNHLPPNIPEKTLDHFFDYLLPRLKK